MPILWGTCGVVGALAVGLLGGVGLGRATAPAAASQGTAGQSGTGSSPGTTRTTT